MMPVSAGEGTARTGQIAGAVIGSFMAYSLIVGLEGTGRHFVELGLLRLVLVATLVAFARSSRRGALSTAGIALAGVSAVAFLGGAVGAVVTDGWSLDIFAEGDTEAPWYAYVIGLSGILFALGTVTVGIASRSAGRLWIAAVLGGLLFPLAFALGPTFGHFVWLMPWLALAVVLGRGDSASLVHAQPATTG